jgi:hypothetical protein
MEIKARLTRSVRRKTPSPSSNSTRKIWRLLLNAMVIQSCFVALRCSCEISAPVPYARMGSSLKPPLALAGVTLKSQTSFST